MSYTIKHKSEVVFPLKTVINALREAGYSGFPVDAKAVLRSSNDELILAWDTEEVREPTRGESAHRDE